MLQIALCEWALRVALLRDPNHNNNRPIIETCNSVRLKVFKLTCTILEDLLNEHQSY